MIYRYFENELRYLHEAGKAFAEAYPEPARMLNVDSVADRDPYVERLFEGFAFLAGRVHERLDDDLPELTQRFVGLLYPHFLKPFPACSVVAFRPRPGLVAGTVVLPRGTAVLAAPAGPERCACTFTTAHAVRLNPIELATAELHYPPDETSSVRLGFRFLRGADPATVELHPLRLFFQADGPTAATMHVHFTRHVTRVEVRATGGDAPLATVRGGAGVAPVGFGEGESLLPPEPGVFSGVRLLQEYLLYRRRFWGVDLLALAGVPAAALADGFTVEVFFDRPYPEARRFQAENVRLHCAPAVNLFDHDAEPVRVDHTEAEIRVRPSVRHPAGVATYDVQGVVGVEEVSGRRNTYHPYFSLAPPATSDSERTYTVTRRVSVAGRPDVFVALSSPELANGAPPVEVLSVALRCTNGTLPHEALQEGALSQLSPSAPQVADPTNLDQPSLIRYPPLGEDRDLLWALLAQWTFNHGSVATREALVGLLELYDWADTEANRRRRRGIRAVRWRPHEVLHRGAIRRGAQVTVEVDDGAFGEEGDLCLFGLVLSAFLSGYATINAFVHLVIESVPSGARYTWTPDRGLRPPV